jgi:hypothetical protein
MIFLKRWFASTDPTNKYIPRHKEFIKLLGNSVLVFLFLPLPGVLAGAHADVPMSIKADILSYCRESFFK